ncbi:hypothetical protein P171DRAFT_167889 [Karstenula rhodostoma CBS 690.94]|uniref:Uncharacterized protein n=1 Tax=Karstenula rhodostoma CBS 690.94 TaxID=1392251 RepID=A0A9P4P764_9PLEO|nr:hypothetical protein P171DRAFT_167889 [Karstenula rhodostoma CBS 690.94]
MYLTTHHLHFHQTPPSHDGTTCVNTNLLCRIHPPTKVPLVIHHKENQDHTSNNQNTRTSHCTNDVFSLALRSVVL